MELSDINKRIADLDNLILVKETEIMVQKNPSVKAKLLKQLDVLRLKKEIEGIKKKIKQIS